MLSILESSRIAALACAVLVAPASAQTAEEVLERASQAIKTAEQGRATVALDVQAQGGEYAERLSQALPDGTAAISWRRAAEGTPRAFRVTGDVRGRKSEDPESINVLFTDGQPAYVDDARKRVVKLAPGRSDRTVSLTEQFHLTAFIDDRPLLDAFAGAEISLDGTATHDGELCDVLVVAYSKGPDGEKPKFSVERWMIARSDAFPRRIERELDMSILGKANATLALTDITLGDALTGETFELDVPEGYVGAGNAALVRPQTVRPVQQTQAQPAPRTENPVAPEYSITDVNGVTYDNTTQEGRVTVLYFWGTWCIPCREYSPLVSALAEQYDGRNVDVLGLAIRERTETAAGELMADKGYKHTLVNGASGAVRPFRVRVYPTIVVIGPDQTILATEHPSKGVSTEETMRAVRAAIAKGLE